MGDNYDGWADQFKNDLENLFINQSLQLIGGFVTPGKNNKFKFVMYKTIEMFNVTFKFDLDVESLYGQITAEEFETYLNAKYSKEKLVFVSAFSVSRSVQNGEAGDSSNAQMNLIVFQDMKVNFEEYNVPFHFTVKQMPLVSSRVDKEFALLKIIESEKEKNGLEFLGLLPSLKSTDSLMVFSN
mmetsp:Transcript_10873/g.12228  ORF Transcript_10873/g.12228 Transcript_10873/m.12228 type:complete len:184 (-) Transcript_10873:52-603(-)